MKKEERKLIEKFFAQYPVCHAIPRANEALAIKTVKFTSPILDLGCGDGKFTLFTFGPGKIQVGLDKGKEEVAKAQKSGAYKEVVLADATVMPFKDETFATVVANSALEHVENLEGVLVEISRVLEKGGFLVLTVPTLLVSDYQFWKLIPGYVEFKRKLWRHVNYFGKKEWQKRLKGAGFKLVSVKRTNSKSAIKWADIFFPLVLIGPLKEVIPFLEKRKVFGFSKDGATLLMVAEKR